MKLWQWLKGKRIVEGDVEGETRPAQPPRGPQSTLRAVETAEADWAQNGEREDQDYYHVPGADNPDRNNPPKLDGWRLDRTGRSGR